MYKLILYNTSLTSMPPNLGAKISAVTISRSKSQMWPNGECSAGGLSKKSQCQIFETVPHV